MRRVSRYETRYFEFSTAENPNISVRVRISGDDTFIYIDTNECVPYVSGILNPKFPLQPVVTLPDGTRAFRSVYPSKRYATAQNIPRDWFDCKELNADPSPALQLAGVENVATHYRGSQYSGEMRKVVQILTATNVDSVSYAPLFYLTHGVYTANDGSKWIIEIGMLGVFAYRMNMCAGPGNDSGNTLGYVPKNTIRPRRTRDGLIVLLSGDYVAQHIFKDYLPFFSNCGWAFNTKGDRAINVAQKFKGRFVYGALLEIKITEGNNVPASAEFMMREEDPMLAPPQYHMKYPALPNGTLYSFSLDYDPYQRWVPCYAPVYAFFDGDNEVICYFTFSPGADRIGGFPDCPCLSKSGRTCYYPGGYSGSDGPSFVVKGAASYETHFGEFTTTVTSVVSYSFKENSKKAVYVSSGTSSSFPLGATFTELYISGQTNSTFYGATASTGACLLVPANDRQVVYLASFRSVYIASTDTYYKEEVVTGDVYTLEHNGDVCCYLEEPTNCHVMSFKFVNRSSSDCNISYTSGGGPTVYMTSYDGGTYRYIKSDGPWPEKEHDICGGYDDTSVELISNIKLAPNTASSSSDDRTTDKVVKVFASGGVNFEFIPPKEPLAHWINMIDPNVAQYLYVSRDAFDDKHYELSTSLYGASSEIGPSDHGYPLKTASSNIFVGVP